MPKLAKLLSGLDFTDTDIISASLKQPTLFLQACDYRIEQMRRRRVAESKLSLVRASLALKRRAKAKAQGERITEGNVGEYLLLDPEFRKASRLVNVALELEEHAKLLVEAYRQRRDVCRIIADISRSQEYGSSKQVIMAEQAATMVAMKQRLEKRYPGGEA